MVWVIIGVWLVLGTVINICFSHDKGIPESKKKYGASTTTWIAFGLLGVVALVLILYGLGWVWYYICGGGLIFEDISFGSKVAAGFASLVGIAVIIGLIAIFAGWDPWER